MAGYGVLTHSHILEPLATFLDNHLPSRPISIGQAGEPDVLEQQEKLAGRKSKPSSFHSGFRWCLVVF